MGAPNHCAGRQMSTGGAEKSQQFHKYVLQYSKFPSEGSQVRTWGRQTCFLPRAPSNLITPLLRRLGLSLFSNKIGQTRGQTRS